MNKLLIMITISNSILFLLMKTPLSMGLMMLIQTLSISLLSGMMSFNFWYAYILFLVMLGGMLILFIYVSSLSLNQKFNMNKKFFKIYFILLIIMILMIFFMKYNYFTFNNEIMPITNIELEQNFLLKMSMNKLFNKPTNLIMFLLINYLLLTLFIIVKITNINLGPLRKCI